MTQTKPSIHKEVVTGVVQVIKFLHTARQSSQKSISMSDLWKAGCEGKNEDAQMYIFEFIKDGVVNLRPEDMQKVIDGDYSGIWSTTNKYLKVFGYEPIEPVQIEL